MQDAEPARRDGRPGQHVQNRLGQGEAGGNGYNLEAKLVQPFQVDGRNFEINRQGYQPPPVEAACLFRLMFIEAAIAHRQECRRDMPEFRGEFGTDKRSGCNEEGPFQVEFRLTLGLSHE